MLSSVSSRPVMKLSRIPGRTCMYMCEKAIGVVVAVLVRVQSSAAFDVNVVWQSGRAVWAAAMRPVGRCWVAKGTS